MIISSYFEWQNRRYSHLLNNNYDCHNHPFEAVIAQKLKSLIKDILKNLEDSIRTHELRMI
jgi:hypothetical protein